VGEEIYRGYTSIGWDGWEIRPEVGNTPLTYIVDDQTVCYTVKLAKINVMGKEFKACQIQLPLRSF
jgi:hypothetical protein